jgi:hypothetical protein
MEIARTLLDFLEVARFEVQVVGDGTAALAAVRGHKLTWSCSTSAAGRRRALRRAQDRSIQHG